MKPESQPSSTLTSRQITYGLLGLCITLFLFYVVADRLIPNTDMARVQGSVIPVSAQVSGEVVSVDVIANQLLEKGAPLLTIDNSDYELAVKKAEQGLAQAGKQVGVHTAGVESAQARLSDAVVNLEDVRRQSRRIFAMAEKGIVAQADVDKQKAALAHANVGVENAKAGLEQAKSQLGEGGERNTDIQAALLALQKAQLDLKRTTVTAPAKGVVSNLTLDEGVYAAKGQPLMTFISAEDVWLEAYYRENNLGNIKAGDTAEIVLDNAPGEVFKGHVISIDYGVNWGQSAQPSGLASVSSKAGWLRQSQRFPVMIRFDDERAQGLLRIGGQADTIVYTGENTIMNALGRVWIRLISWMSYVR